MDYLKLIPPIIKIEAKGTGCNRSPTVLQNIILPQFLVK